MTLKVHHLKPAPGSHTKKTRVGRGEGSKGKTAGRGTKGTKARYQVPVGFEGGQMPIHMRMPKLRGFTNRNKVAFQVVNVAQLASLFPQGGTVGVTELVAGRCRPQGRAGQGARQRRAGRQARHHRGRVLRERARRRSPPPEAPQPHSDAAARRPREPDPSGSVFGARRASA